MLSSCRIHVFIFGKFGVARKKKGKDTHRLQEGGKHSGNGKSGTSAWYANFTCVEDHAHGDDTAELEDTYRAHSDPSDLGGDGRQEVPGWAVYEKNDTFSPYDAPDDVYTLEASGLDVIAPLADRQDDDLDPEVSAQLGKPKNKLIFLFERRKVSAKPKARANFLFVHHVCIWRIADNG